ncbi:hypothetical protein IWW56_003887 [Coemansia sp. RSA 2131]|nr:hypothetical protein IWW56_003887 [Coemansia sp. RSA 2131]
MWPSVSLREFQDQKCNIVQKYSDEEVSNLRKAEQLPKKSANTGDAQQEEEDDDLVEFDLDIDEL